MRRRVRSGSSRLAFPSNTLTWITEHARPSVCVVRVSSRAHQTLETDMALMDMVQQHLGQAEVSQISQQLGISPGVAQTAIAAAIPMIVGGMARHASQPQGAETIQNAITAHDGVTDNVGTVLQAGPPADTSSSGGLLGRILGTHHDAVQQGVQQASGLDSEKAKKLLMMLSPIVLG